MEFSAVPAKPWLWLTGTGDILGSLEDSSYRAAAGTLAAFGMATKGIDALGAANSGR